MLLDKKNDIGVRFLLRKYKHAHTQILDLYQSLQEELNKNEKVKGTYGLIHELQEQEFNLLSFRIKVCQFCTMENGWAMVGK